MVTLSPSLATERLQQHDLARSSFEFLETDVETQSCLRMANVMAVGRLRYNDHGAVHSRIVVGSAMLIFDLIRGREEMSVVRDGMGDQMDSRVVVVTGAYLHDIGNCIHRSDHHVNGCTIANPILSRMFSKLYPSEPAKSNMLKLEALHCIYSHDEDVNCLSVEAGIAKVADGTDMAEGRARIPYKTGKLDIHAVSALAIQRVEIEAGEEKPVQLRIHMDNAAGIFQIDEVLDRKIQSSSIAHLVEVMALHNGKELRTVPSWEKPWRR